MVARVLCGERIGWALDDFNIRHARLATELAGLQQKVKFGYHPDAEEVAYLWTANNDARAFIVIGDPAVRLNLAAEVEESGQPSSLET
jgi:hypothetical protein